MQVLDYLGRLVQIDHSEQLVRSVFLFDTRNGRLTWRTVLRSPRLFTNHSKM
jgi:hypothetical protein